MKQLRAFWLSLQASARDLAPIVMVIAFFQLIVLQQPLPNLSHLLMGLCLVVLGLSLFVYGLETALFPLGENMAFAFARKANVWWLLVFAFALGFGTTIAEPALIAVADEAAKVVAVGGVIAMTDETQQVYANGLRLTVALSVGLAIVIGVFRIIKGWPIHYLIICGYLSIVIMTTFAPPWIIGIAYDSGGVTTSTITVPLVTALGVGLASSIKGRNPMIDGFGLIAFASLTPMIFVMLYGILVESYPHIIMNPVWYSNQHTLQAAHSPFLGNFAWLIKRGSGLSEFLSILLETIRDVLPIIMIIFGFQLLVIRRAIPQIKSVLLGLIYVILGLALFLQGLKQALFPLGEIMAQQLTDPAFIYDSIEQISSSPHWTDYQWVYLFAAAIGFATTLAEPSLIAVAIKANQVSGGTITLWGLRIAVAIGVAIGIALGSFRIVTGTPLHYYIIIGYIIVVIQTFYAPRQIIPLAYDSGGVTTSTVTVPLVAALGLGLAATIPERDPLIDGFGLIAFASLFPMMTVMGYAQLSHLLYQVKSKKGDH